ncbi:gamma-glutamyltransferase [Pilobolus umbonatus]|nr:gamma-glutamyltransferase [Pilobolus umbonatus]
MNEDRVHLLSPRPVARQTKKWIYYLLILIALIGTSLFTLFFLKESPESPVNYQKQLVKGSKAAVAVEAETCSDIGLEIIHKGGNAVDSAIASALCIGVMHNFATGGFMLIRSPNGTYDLIDFRERAGERATRDMFVEDPSLAEIGGLAVAVPGELRGLELAHQRHGSLPWYDLVAPAIQLARDGFKATELLERRLKPEAIWMQSLPEWTDIYFQNGRMKKEGEIVKRPNLATTLERVAIEGADAFYTGDIARHLVDTVNANGGNLTMEDFASYKPLIRDTIHTFYNGRKITTGSLPTSGPVLLSILNLIERFQFTVEGRNELNLQRLIEAFKFGYAFRTEMGDPDYLHNEERIDEIISKDYAARIRMNISDDQTHEPAYYNPKFDHVDSHGTMTLSVVDENDGAVTLTSTVNLSFGSHVMDPTTGVILNNEMDDFSIPGTPNMFGLFPSAYNYIEPGKRPLSSITPVIVETDSKFELALGGSGGSMIPTATLNVTRF